MAWGAIGKSLMAGLKSQLTPQALMQNGNQARLSADPGNPANGATGIQSQQQPPPSVQAGDPGVGQAQRPQPIQGTPLMQLIQAAYGRKTPGAAPGGPPPRGYVNTAGPAPGTYQEGDQF